LNQESTSNLEALIAKLVQFLNPCKEHIKEKQELCALKENEKHTKHLTLA
jgi:hypothetical protein